MEEKSMDLNSNVANIQLSPPKDIRDIILKFDESGVSGEPFSFNNFVEDKTNVENRIMDVKQTRFPLEENERKSHDEKDDLSLIDLSEIDFEISKDMFDDIKIKEEDIIGFDEKVSSQLSNGREKNINFKLPFFTENVDDNGVTSVDCEIKNDAKETLKTNLVNENHQMEMGLEDSLEIPLCEEKEIYSSSNNEVKRIMTELQVNHDSNENLRSKDNNCAPSVSENFNKLIVGNITDEEKLKNSILTKENVSTLAVIGSDIDMILDSKVHLNSQENILLHTQSYKNINDTIESIIQESLQQDLDSKDSSNQEEINGKQEEKKTPYGIFEVVVPLIGKNVMETGNDVPFTQRYDLARKQNEMRAKFQKNDPDFSIPNMSFEEWRKRRQSRTKEEIAAEERKKVANAIQLARSFTKIAISILLEYEKDEPNQAAMTKFFRYFEFAPASPLSLLYAPHFVHTMMLCRGDDDLSPNLRRAANDCYDKCHALFPIPEGYNFETVYTSEVKKYIPDGLDKLSDFVLDYGDYDSSDFEDDASDSSNDSDRDWE